MRNKTLNILKLLIVFISMIAISSQLGLFGKSFALEEQSGTYDGVDWHLSTDGVLTIGKEDETQTFENRSSRYSSSYPWDSFRSEITSVNFAGEVKGQGSMEYMFYNMSNATSINLSNFDTSNVTNMSSMFRGCSSLTSLDVSSFNTSSVTNMSYMFYNCRNLASLDISAFDTSNVTNMYAMFYDCEKLSSLDLSTFDTSNVIYMDSMFHDCRSLTSLDVSNFDTSNVKMMQEMFYNCNSLIDLDLSNFNTSNVINMKFMFSDCYKLKELNITSFNTSNVTNMESMFSGCYELKELNITSFNTSNVTNMKSMFSGCNKLKELNITSFNTSNVTSMQYMFSGCYELTELNITSFNTSNVTNMSYMFTSCSALTSLDISNFDTSSVTNMSNAFYNTPKLKEITIGSKADLSYSNHTEYYWSKTKQWSDAVEGIKNINSAGTWYKTEKCPSEYERHGDYDEVCWEITDDNVLNIGKEDKEQIFANKTSRSASSYPWNNYKSEIKAVNFVGTVKGQGSMAYMFSNMYDVTSIDLANFDTLNVTNMSYMFYNCVKLTNLDLSNFDTSNVTNMSKILLYTLKLEKIIVGSKTDLSDSKHTEYYWTKTKQMSDAVKGMENINSAGTWYKIEKCPSEYVRHGDYDEVCWEITDDNILNIGKKGQTQTFSNNSSRSFPTYPWFQYCEEIDSVNFVGPVIGQGSMAYMFSHMYNVTSIDLANFDTLNVTNMSRMFYNCGKLTNLDLSNFDTSNVTNMSYMFQGCSSLQNLNISNFDTSKVTYMDYMFNNTSKLKEIKVGSQTNLSISGHSDYLWSKTKQMSDTVQGIQNINSAGTWYKTYKCLSEYEKHGEYDGVCWEITDKGVLNIGKKDETQTFTDRSFRYYNSYPWSAYSPDITSVNFVNKVKGQGSMAYMFLDMSNATNINLSNFDTSNVTNMDSMFANCSSLTSLDFSNFDTSKVTNMSYMFYCCHHLQSIDLSNFDTTKVTSMDMFLFATSSLKQITVGPLVDLTKTSDGDWHWSKTKSEADAVEGIRNINSPGTWYRLKLNRVAIWYPNFLSLLKASNEDVPNYSESYDYDLYYNDEKIATTTLDFGFISFPMLKYDEKDLGKKFKYKIVQSENDYYESITPRIQEVEITIEEDEYEDLVAVPNKEIKFINRLAYQDLYAIIRWPEEDDESLRPEKLTGIVFDKSKTVSKEVTLTLNDRNFWVMKAPVLDDATELLYIHLNSTDNYNFTYDEYDAIDYDSNKKGTPINHKLRTAYVYAELITTGKLKLTKEISNETDSKAEFKFKVTFTLKDGVKLPEFKNENIKKISDTEYEVTIKGNDSVTFENIEPGVLYEVEEIDIPDKYILKSESKINGEIVIRQTKEAKFINEKDKTIIEEIIDKIIKPKPKKDEQKQQDVEKTTTKTGIGSAIANYVLVVGSSILSISLISFIRAMQKRKRFQ